MQKFPIFRLHESPSSDYWLIRNAYCSPAALPKLTSYDGRMPFQKPLTKFIVSLIAQMLITWACYSDITLPVSLLKRIEIPSTLTRSTLEWVNPKIIDDLDTDSVAALRTISMASSHPITTTIRECLLAGGIPKDARKWEVKETIGQGVEARNGDNVWRFRKIGLDVQRRWRIHSIESQSRNFGGVPVR